VVTEKRLQGEDGKEKMDLGRELLRRVLMR
jgi:hypothetical protein